MLSLSKHDYLCIDRNPEAASIRIAVTAQFPLYIAQYSAYLPPMSAFRKVSK
jgi:hypothetical protein